MFYFSVSEASCFEKALLKDLFKDYDKDMRPVLNDSDTVTVKIGLSLHQIMDVVSKNTIPDELISYNHLKCQKSVLNLKALVEHVIKQSFTYIETNGWYLFAKNPCTYSEKKFLCLHKSTIAHST